MGTPLGGLPTTFSRQSLLQCGCVLLVGWVDMKFSLPQEEFDQVTMLMEEIEKVKSEGWQV